MISLADKAILSGADNSLPMLEKDMYNSWKSRMELYMLNRQHGWMILESVENGPLLWPTIEENGVTRLKKYSELSTTEAIQDNYDVKATNIILQGLPPEQERECKLYDEFDKLAYRKGESVHDFYLRFSLLLNDMNIYYMKLEQFQVNIKFLNTLPPEWSKFETHVNGCYSRYPATNNQLRTSSNPCQQATINNGRVTIQPIQRRHNSMTAGSSRPYTYRSSGTLGKQRVIMCYNCKGEGHMSKQCTKPKKKRDKEWFKDKAELSAEQAFWSRYSVQSEEPNLSLIKERTTPTAIAEGTWGFKHTKACFRDEIISFVKALKELLNSFDQLLIVALTEVQNVFNQMEQAIAQHCVEKKNQDKMKNVLKDNERLLEQAISIDIVNIVVHDHSQEKDTVIVKLKERLKSLSGSVKEEKIKRELEEIETINIELDHKVTKLVAENKHLKQTYKQLYDSIKFSRVRSKEQCGDLIKQVNIKSAKNSDLNASLQEKVLGITALKETLSKLKGKVVVTEAVTLHPIDPVWKSFT
nr:hypothetical protein [Tanacetum cinerariifolium]